MNNKQNETLIVWNNHSTGEQGPICVLKQTRSLPKQGWVPCGCESQMKPMTLTLTWTWPWPSVQSDWEVRYTWSRTEKHAMTIAQRSRLWLKLTVSLAMGGYALGNLYREHWITVMKTRYKMVKSMPRLTHVSSAQKSWNAEDLSVQTTCLPVAMLDHHSMAWLFRE